MSENRISWLQIASLQKVETFGVLCEDAALKWITFIFAAVFLSATAGSTFAQGTGAETVAPLKKVADIRVLSYEEAANAMPVKLRGVVTAHINTGFDFQDQSGGIFVRTNGEIPPIGTTVTVEGRLSQGEYSPFVDSTLVLEVGTGKMPRPLGLAPEYLLTGAADNHWVQTQGTVVYVQPGDGKRRRYLTLATGTIDLEIRIGNEYADISGTDFDALVGNNLQIEGTCGPLFNDKKQRIGSFVTCPDMKFVKVLTNPQVSVDTMEVTPIPQIRSWNQNQRNSKAGGVVKTRGYVTTVEGNRELVMQDGKRGMQVKLARKPDFEIEPGEAIEATGFPVASGFHVELRYGVVKKLDGDDLPKRLPKPDEESDILSTAAAFSEVSRMARLVEIRPNSDNREVAVLEIGEHLVRGVFAPAAVVPQKLEPGSIVQVTGVKMVDADVNGEIKSAWLSLRGPQDLELISKPSWWTPARYLMAIGLLAVSVVAAIMWLTALRRQVTAQTATIEHQAQKNATLEERNRIAREFHDTLSQGFAGVGFQLASVENDVSRNPERAREKLELARRMVEHSMAEARQSLTNLRTPLLDGQSLSQAIEIEAKRLCETAGINLKSEIDTQGAGSLLPEKTQHEVLRIVLESIANAGKHSRANTLTLTMKGEDDLLKIRVMDDGIGFDPESFRDDDEHFGLRGMRERARQIGADLRIESAKGAPSIVSLQLPLPEPIPTPEETTHDE